MLDHLNETEAGNQLETAMTTVIKKMDSMAAGKMGYSTTDIGDMIVTELKAVSTSPVN